MVWFCMCTGLLLLFRVVDARVDEGVFDVTSFGAMGDGTIFTHFCFNTNWNNRLRQN